VKFCKQSEKWIAYIQIDGKYRHLGSFATPAMASVAYEAAHSERLEILTG
jgi:hypothetical protein